jgi:Protein of unknown function (DUF2950)
MSGLIRRALLAFALCAGLSAGALAQTPQLRGFPTPEAAADALTEAIRKDDDKAITAILGSSWHDFLPGSDQDDDEDRAKFLKAWDEGHKIIPENDGRVLVGVGSTGWISPLPIIKQGSDWRYDIVAGQKELQARQIGRNELSVVQTLLAIVDAQRDYASLDPMKTGFNVYARRLLSSPGRKDGLYWETKPGEPPSPIGPLLAKAQLGEAQEKGYYGYRFRLLYSQGPDAPGGAYDYLVKGRMIGGFAVIAWPVRYGDTGVMTFIVSQAGDVYEQDFGPDTAQETSTISVFNPDKSWAKADMTP